MASYQKKKIQDTDNSGFGKYNEDTGGGKPFSTSNTRTTKENGKYRRANNKTMQARTEDGKFTYKSVNGDSIDPKYGPSRGKTVNPLLTGGQNGIKIEDVEQQFYSQSGAYWNKYKDKWYQKGGEIVTSDLKTRIAKEAIWNIAKRSYDKVKGELEGESHTFDETKKGRSGKEESAAKQKAKATGEEQAVISQKTGGIKLKPGVSIPAPQPKPSPAQPVGQTPVIPPTIGGQQPTVGQQPSAFVGGGAPKSKYSDEDLKTAKDFFTTNNIPFDGLTVSELDSLIDEYFEEDTSEDSEDNNNPPAPPAPPATPNTQNNQVPEEDSEAIKKIKKMGFDGE